MPDTTTGEAGQTFVWDGTTWKASIAVFLMLFAGGGPVIAEQAALDPVPSWLEIVVVVTVTTGLGFAAWAIGDVLEESSLVVLVLVSGVILLLIGGLWSNAELHALEVGSGVPRAWLAMSVFAAGFATIVGWFVAVLRTPQLRRRAVAALVTGAAVASGIAAALGVLGT